MNDLLKEKQPWRKEISEIKLELKKGIGEELKREKI